LGGVVTTEIVAKEDTRVGRDRERQSRLSCNFHGLDKQDGEQVPLPEKLRNKIAAVCDDITALAGKNLSQIEQMGIPIDDVMSLGRISHCLEEVLSKRRGISFIRISRQLSPDSNEEDAAATMIRQAQQRRGKIGVSPVSLYFGSGPTADQENKDGLLQDEDPEILLNVNEFSEDSAGNHVEIHVGRLDVSSASDQGPGLNPDLVSLVNEDATLPEEGDFPLEDGLPRWEQPILIEVNREDVNIMPEEIEVEEVEAEVEEVEETEEEVEGTVTEEKYSLSNVRGVRTQELLRDAFGDTVSLLDLDQMIKDNQAERILGALKGASKVVPGQSVSSLNNALEAAELSTIPATQTLKKGRISTAADPILVLDSAIQERLRQEFDDGVTLEQIADAGQSLEGAQKIWSAFTIEGHFRGGSFRALNGALGNAGLLKIRAKKDLVAESSPPADPQKDSHALMEEAVKTIVEAVKASQESMESVIQKKIDEALAPLVDRQEKATKRMEEMLDSLSELMSILNKVIIAADKLEDAAKVAEYRAVIVEMQQGMKAFLNFQVQ